MKPLRIDDDGFTWLQLRVTWNELVAVGIRTTADGPFSDDVFWQFFVRDGLHEVPGWIVTDLEALSKHLPGLDFGRVIRAMGSCDERVFRVWHHEQSHFLSDEDALRSRFVQLTQRLGARWPAHEQFARVYAAYASETRRYHDLVHIRDCLRELDAAPHACNRDVVELALWYHDVVYDTRASDSERRSAELLVADAAALGINERVAGSAAALVLATAHGSDRAASDVEAADAGDAAVIADIDLAILGRDPLCFMDFEYGIAEEFSAMPKATFFLARGRFLARLLQTPIYRTASFRDRYEATARANIGALLQSRRYAAYRWLRWLPG